MLFSKKCKVISVTFRQNNNFKKRCRCETTLFSLRFCENLWTDGPFVRRRLANSRSACKWNWSQSSTSSQSPHLEVQLLFYMLVLSEVSDATRNLRPVGNLGVRACVRSHLHQVPLRCHAVAPHPGLSVRGWRATTRRGILARPWSLGPSMV